MLDILVADPGCPEQLSWRSQVEAHEVSVLLDALDGLGLSCLARHPELRLFREQKGHEVIVAAKTGRVRTRVDRSVPPDQRAKTAAQFLERVRQEALVRLSTPRRVSYLRESS